MEIKVLGPGCPKCQKTLDHVKQAVRETGADAAVNKVTDIMAIAKLGVLGTPAVVLEKEYKGKAAIIFIDVWKDRRQAERFAVSAIPTQVFFDKTGKEVFRHVGFLDEDFIAKQLEEMGVARPSSKKR